ncbi:MAG: imidazole glycerol phosphate synthase subunit HisF [Candidatus Aminicenantales bacterium]
MGEKLLAVRIIPCLDIDHGRVVKGVRFRNLRDAGDPVTLARYYSDQGADELTFLDVGASIHSRKILVEVVHLVSKEIFIPLTVGGGLRRPENIREVLCAGADKISICTAAVENPRLITTTARQFGSQCVVLSIDAQREGGSWVVCTHGGRRKTDVDAIDWAVQGESLGAGEILLNSIDQDGTRSGYDIALTRRIRRAVRIPVIASGGAGTLEQILAAATRGAADAVLMASVLHYGRYTIPEVKSYLREKGVHVR